MDDLELTKEIEELKKLRENYESQIKIMGLDMSELDEETQALLDDYVELQECTNLSDLRLPNLKTFYYEKKGERIEKEMLIKMLEIDVEKQESDLEKERAECASLKSFIETTSKQLVSESTMENAKLKLETNTKILKKKLDNAKIPEDFDIDEIIKKVEALSGSKQKK